MSKVNAMQAIREARYAARASGKPAPATDPIVPKPEKVAGPADPRDAVPAVPRSASVRPEMERAETGPSEMEPAEALCGHRSMNNRICKRPAGHSEKNHRYS